MKMKKDIEWLKAQICIEMMYLEHNRKERWSGVKYQTLRSVYQKINQLDETEVLSQEWIDKHKVTRISNLRKMTMSDVVPVEDLQNLLVPKQELPVVPKFVADWWERDDDSVTMYEGVRIEKKHKLDLVSFFQDRGLSDSLSEVEDWLDENDSIFLDLVNGKPYEVEKEKLYIVQLPTNSEDDLIILDADGDIWKDCWPSQYKMTEQRIKEIDERYWPFAVEVAE